MNSYQPTSYVFNLYAANDYRASERFLQRHIVAATSSTQGTNGDIAKGDVVIYQPREAMTAAEIAAYKSSQQANILCGEPRSVPSIFGSITIYPIVWKFYDSTVVSAPTTG